MLLTTPSLALLAPPLLENGGEWVGFEPNIPLLFKEGWRAAPGWLRTNREAHRTF
jgi:hypothetical protein